MNSGEPPGDRSDASSLAGFKAEFKLALSAHRLHVEWIRARRARGAPPAPKWRREMWKQAVAEKFHADDRVVTVPPPVGTVPSQFVQTKRAPGWRFDGEAARRRFIDDVAAALINDGLVALRVTLSREKDGPVPERLDTASLVAAPSQEKDRGRRWFMAEMFEADLATLRERGCYHGLDRIDLAAAPTLAAHPEFSLSPAAAPAAGGGLESKKLLVCEFWGWGWGRPHDDGSRFAKPVVAAWVGDTLIRCEDNPHPDKLPPFMVLALPAVVEFDDDGALKW